MGQTNDTEFDAAPVQTPAAPEKVQVPLLICKCQDCTHWEIGKDFILCKTCGLQIPATVTVDDSHHMLHWENHTR